jgi:ketosteroid isomerase-like protein
VEDVLMTDTAARIYSILGELQDGVAAKDLGALSALLDDDTVVFGTAAANADRQESISYLAQVIAQEGTVRWTWDTVLPLVDESHLLVFAVVGTVGFDDAEGRPVGQRDVFRLTAVAVNRDGHWRLSHFHGSVPQVG